MAERLIDITGLKETLSTVRGLLDTAWATAPRKASGNKVLNFILLDRSLTRIRLPFVGQVTTLLKKRASFLTLEDSYLKNASPVRDGNGLLPLQAERFSKTRFGRSIQGVRDTRESKQTVRRYHVHFRVATNVSSLPSKTQVEGSAPLYFDSDCRRGSHSHPGREIGERTEEVLVRGSGGQRKGKRIFGGDRSPFRYVEQSLCALGAHIPYSPLYIEETEHQGICIIT